MAKLLKKLSAKTILGRKVTINDINTDLYLAYGVASGVRSGETNYGPWTALVGQFEAVNLSTGEVVQGVQLFLPEPVNGMIADRLRNGADSVEFSVRVSLAEDNDSVTGYTYVAEPITDPAKADPLATLRENLKPMLPPPPPSTEPSAVTSTGKRTSQKKSS